MINSETLSACLRTVRRAGPRVLFLALLIVHTRAQAVFAQLQLADAIGPPSTSAVFAGQASPHLDGILDDTAWQTTPVVHDFTQILPEDGSVPSERTEIRVLYDEQALYIAARMFDRDPSAIVGRLGRRDSNTSSDKFVLSIDSYHDHRTAYRFDVNPAGVRSDYVATNDSDNEDFSWDPVWEVATRIDSLGWVAEIRIPFSQLRFSGDEEQTWGINFTRYVFRKSEWMVWSWWDNELQGFTSHFGHLEGLRGLKTPRRLEILPYTVAKSDHIQGADANNPFHDGSLQTVTGGLDVNFGLTSELTLNATINPDFGQVEADPAEVNLTAFETFFEERRPFFVEGANLFQFGAGSGGFIFGAPQLFYSRRIGRAPSRPASEPGGYVDNPINTSILGAAKISGQTNGWSIGVLDAFTGNERADIQQADGTRRSDPVEPRTNYGVFSLRKDFRDGSSGLGILATTVHRDLGAPEFNTLLSSAYSGGVDFFHRFAENRFLINGTVSGSHVIGKTDAILRTQRSSTRYYQRPDQDHVSVDSMATSLSGFATSFQFDKVSGNWLIGTDFFAQSPGLELNEAGFQQGVDAIFHGIRLTRRWLDPGRTFRRFQVNATWAQSWNFGGTRTSRSVFAGVNGSFLNYWIFNLGLNYRLKGLSDAATRGGPLMESPEQWNVQTFVGSNSRKKVSARARATYARNEYDGWGLFSGMDWTIRPSSGVSLTLSPSFSRTHSMGQYVTQRVDPTAQSTFGSRYLFAELVQTSIDATIRLDVALTPDFSIQWYSQPFIATGDYAGFKELAQPRSFEFIRYGITGNSTLHFDEAAGAFSVDPDGEGDAPGIEFRNPDFRVRSITSNLVFRWEYMLGSTLFFVWNHGRSGFAANPSFQVLDELGNLFRDDMQNTFILKLNYWLSR